MDIDRVYFNANTGAVDASLLTKDRAVYIFSQVNNIPLEQIAAIGDGTNDLPFLRMHGLGMIGAPSNAQYEVREFVSHAPSGILSSREVLDAFLEFYEKVSRTRIGYIISDKDGVLVSKGDLRRGHEFKELARSMGLNGTPLVTVLTASSYEQNTAFMKAYGLDSGLSDNPAVRDYPYLLLAENGAVQYNVLTGEIRDICEDLNPDLLAKLKGDFEKEVKRRVDEEVLPEFGLQWGVDHGDKTEKIYAPPKRSMVSFDLPRNFRDGRDYRSSGNGDRLRKLLLEIMIDTAERIGMKHEVL